MFYALQQCIFVHTISLFHRCVHYVIQNCESILCETKKINAQKNNKNKLTGLTEYMLYIHSINNIQIIRHFYTVKIIWT